MAAMAEAKTKTARGPKLMPPRDTNGSIHGMSLLVGELKGAVGELRNSIEHLNSNWKMKDAEATRGREELHNTCAKLRDDIHGVRGTVESVQQDVAEMKNDMTIMQKTIDDYNANKPMAVAAFGDVGKLKEFVAGFEKKEQRILGWWDIIKSIGGGTWMIICAVGAGAIGLLFFWLQRFL